jgi:hypothetical protein
MSLLASPTPAGVVVTVTDAHVERLLAALEEDTRDWIAGKFGGGTAQDADMTIFGPFGGLLRGTTELSGRQERAAAMFHGGSGHHELVKTIVAGDTVVVVLIERNETRVQGSDVPQPWVLRTTQVFEFRDDEWVRLHRHADPLIDLRPPDITFALARGGSPAPSL